MTLITNALVTAYCACRLCCGDHAHSQQLTASGVKPLVGRTIAGPRNIPLGTVVIIGNKRYVVEDRTARKYDGRWDIYFRNHKEAMKFGKQQLTVRILKR